MNLALIYFKINKKTIQKKKLPHNLIKKILWKFKKYSMNNIKKETRFNLFMMKDLKDKRYYLRH